MWHKQDPPSTTWTPFTDALYVILSVDTAIELGLDINTLLLLDSQTRVTTWTIVDIPAMAVL